MIIGGGWISVCIDAGAAVAAGGKRTWITRSTQLDNTHECVRAPPTVRSSGHCRGFHQYRSTGVFLRSSSRQHAQFGYSAVPEHHRSRQLPQQLTPHRHRESDKTGWWSSSSSTSEWLDRRQPQQMPSWLFLLATSRSQWVESLLLHDSGSLAQLQEDQQNHRLLTPSIVIPHHHHHHHHNYILVKHFPQFTSSFHDQPPNLCHIIKHQMQQKRQMRQKH